MTALEARRIATAVVEKNAAETEAKIALTIIHARIRIAADAGRFEIKNPVCGLSAATEQIVTNALTADGFQVLPGDDGEHIGLIEW